MGLNWDHFIKVKVKSSGKHLSPIFFQIIQLVIEGLFSRVISVFRILNHRVLKKKMFAVLKHFKIEVENSFAWSINRVWKDRRTKVVKIGILVGRHHRWQHPALAPTALPGLSSAIDQVQFIYLFVFLKNLATVQTNLFFFFAFCFRKQECAEVQFKQQLHYMEGAGFVYN